MPRMLKFRNGQNQYSVNADRVSFVVRGEHDTKTRIFFSGGDNDFIEVEEDFDEVDLRLSAEFR